MAVRIKTKKPVKKISKPSIRKTKRKTSKKKIIIPAKKISGAQAKKHAEKLKKKISPGKSADRKLSKKIKKKPVKKAKVTKRPLILGRRITKKTRDERKIDLRRFLINKREDVIKEAKEEISKYIKGETRQLVETAFDDGDWSIIDLTEDISLRQLSTHRENLLKIDEALRKLDEGTYGICEDCGEEISKERLKVMPFAIYCIDCQEKQEQLEKIKIAEGLR